MNQINTKPEKVYSEYYSNNNTTASATNSEMFDNVLLNERELQK